MGGLTGRRRLTAGALLAVATTVAVAACTGSGSSSGSSAVVAGGEGALRAGAAAAGRPAAASSGARSAVDVASTAQIRQADITVAVGPRRSVAQQADRADAIAVRAGGEVDRDDRTSARDATATIVLRVPPTKLAAVLTKLSGLGSERTRHLSTEDVTARVADVNSRVLSEQAAIQRLRLLYQQAKKVGDIIAIENEMAGREADLESLQAQQRALTAQTATASVTLYLLTAHPRAVPKPVHHRSGFVGGLENGWDALVRAASWAATVLGAILPFAVLLLAVGVAARMVWVRLRPMRTRTASPD